MKAFGNISCYNLITGFNQIVMVENSEIGSGKMKLIRDESNDCWVLMVVNMKCLLWRYVGGLWKGNYKHIFNVLEILDFIRIIDGKCRIIRKKTIILVKKN